MQKGAIIDREGKIFTVMTNLVKEKHIRDADILRQCPRIFQEYIEKDFEIRVTAIGDEIMGTAIHSQESILSKIDYRRYDFNVPYISIKLPRKVEDFCRLMLQNYGLRFGTFDFIKSKKDEFVFLEINLISTAGTQSIAFSSCFCTIFAIFNI